MNSALVLILASVSASLVGCAAETEDNALSISTQQDAVQGGTVDRSDPAVGLLAIGDTSGNYQGFCTGTLIARNVVLTAAHCVVDGPILGFYTGVGKVVDSSNQLALLNDPAHLVFHAVAAQAAHPSYVAGSCPNITSDVGVVKLSAPIAGVTPLAFAPSSGAPHASDTCSAVGFGLHNTASASTVGQKRTGTQIVDKLTAQSIQVHRKSAIADSGDSGGPLLCGGVVAGVTSCHTDGQAPMHSVEFYQRIDAVSAWVAQRVAAFAH